MGQSHQRPTIESFSNHCRLLGLSPSKELQCPDEAHLDFATIVELFVSSCKDLDVMVIAEIVGAVRSSAESWKLGGVSDEMSFLFREVFGYLIIPSEQGDEVLILNNENSRDGLCRYLIGFYEEILKNATENVSMIKASPPEETGIKKRSFQEFFEKKEQEGVRSCRKHSPNLRENEQKSRSKPIRDSLPFTTNMGERGPGLVFDQPNLGKDLRIAPNSSAHFLPNPELKSRRGGVKTIGDLRNDPSRFQTPPLPPDPVTIKPSFSDRFRTLGDISLKVKRDNQRILGYACFHLTNHYRASKGLDQLEWDEACFKICLDHSENMARGKVPFGHKNFDSRVSKLPNHRAAAENVAYVEGADDGGLAKEVVDGWIASPGHRKNMESKKSHSAVAAFATETDVRYYLTQIFVLY